MNARMDHLTPLSGHVVTIAVTSGKGGVGKTSVIVNLAVALARRGKRVAILDADFGLGNVDVMLGLAPTFHLGHLLNGDKTIQEISVVGPFGVRIVPASSGLRELAHLTPVQWRRLRAALDDLARDVDYLLIDTAPGISSNVIDLLTIAGQVLIVTSLEPTAIVDAYAVIKILDGCDTRMPIGLLINGARDATEGRFAFQQLEIAAGRFLRRGLRYYGFVPQDPALRDAVLVQRPVIDVQPTSPASRSFRLLASELAVATVPRAAGLRVVPGRRPANPPSLSAEGHPCP